jgi:hypothetical protein
MSRVLVAMAFMATGVSTASSPLRVKASPAVAPCVAAASIAYERAAGQGVALSIGELGSPASAGGADVVIGADQELNRIIESGASAPDLDVDVARIPWVLVAAVGAPAMDVRSLGRTGALVRTLDGVVAREAWRNLAQQGLAPGRVERVGSFSARSKPSAAATRRRWRRGDACRKSMRPPVRGCIRRSKPLRRRWGSRRSSRRSCAAFW